VQHRLGDRPSQRSRNRLAEGLGKDPDSSPVSEINLFDQHVSIAPVQ